VPFGYFLLKAELREASVAIVDPQIYGWPLQRFSTTDLERLLRIFQLTVNSRVVSLAKHLRTDLLESNPPALQLGTLRELSKWCHTDYQDTKGGDTALRITLLLFGKVIDRRVFGI
jgi:hypothetical protein